MDQAASKDELYGLRFQVRAKVQRIGIKTDPQNGEITAGVQLAWFGGNQYMKLDSPLMAEKINDGDIIEGFAEARSFKDNTYPSFLVVTSINGKAAPTS